MDRRSLLIGMTGAAPGGALSFPAPAIAQGIRQLKMVTDWPEGSPGLQSSTERLAERITTASDGRIAIKVFPAGTLVRPFETFDAVAAGVADMYHSSEHYWEKKSPAFNFFAAVPFGFTAAELFAWVQVRRWSRTVGRAQRAVQRQTAPRAQHRLPDGRLVHPRDRVAGSIQGAALSDAGSWRRGSSPHWRDRLDNTGWRTRTDAQVRRHRRQRMGRPLA
jgi:hypothetical protein